jgi:hypothetical protein
MDTPAGENNNQNTPYLQALRFARPEATLNDIVSCCKRFGEIRKVSFLARVFKAHAVQTVDGSCRLEKLGGEQLFRWRYSKDMQLHDQLSGAQGLPRRESEHDFREDSSAAMFISFTGSSSAFYT